MAPQGRSFSSANRGVPSTSMSSNVGCSRAGKLLYMVYHWLKFNVSDAEAPGCLTTLTNGTSMPNYSPASLRRREKDGGKPNGRKQGTLVAMASNLRAVASTLIARASTLIALASNLLETWIAGVQKLCLPKLSGLRAWCQDGCHARGTLVALASSRM